jgi:hypothetical protein
MADETDYSYRERLQTAVKHGISSRSSVSERKERYADGYGDSDDLDPCSSPDVSESDSPPASVHGTQPPTKKRKYGHLELGSPTVDSSILPFLDLLKPYMEFQIVLAACAGLEDVEGAREKMWEVMDVVSSLRRVHWKKREADERKRWYG